MKVLVAVDGSKGAATALQVANRLLSRVDRKLNLLCVAPKIARKIAPGRVQANGYEQRILGEIAQILKRARARLKPANGEIHLLAELGSPSASIVSKSGDYDLTVIGAKGRSTQGNAGLGRVASRVVEHAKGPILIARDLRSEDGIRVLVGVDGSTASRHALETLGELFDLNSVEICLMYVAETPWVELGLEEDWVTYSDEEKEQSEAGTMEQELLREGRSVIEQARDVLNPYPVSVNTRLEEGDPANEILSEAERGQYDLVVAGATGSRDLKHYMLGSVSSKIAWNAPCSVLIVREPE